MPAHSKKLGKGQIGTYCGYIEVHNSWSVRA